MPLHVHAIVEQLSQLNVVYFSFKIPQIRFVGLRRRKEEVKSDNQNPPGRSLIISFSYAIGLLHQFDSDQLRWGSFPDSIVRCDDDAAARDTLGMVKAIKYRNGSSSTLMGIL